MVVGVTSVPRRKLLTTEATQIAFRSVERPPFGEHGELVTSLGYEAMERLRLTARLDAVAGVTKVAPNGELAAHGFRQREIFSRKAYDVADVAIISLRQTETKEMASFAMAIKVGCTAVESHAHEVC